MPQDAPATLTPGAQWQFLDALGDGIYGVDATGACVFVNSAAVRMLGYESTADLLGRNMHEVIHHTRPDGTPFPPPPGRVSAAAHHHQRPSGKAG